MCIYNKYIYTCIPGGAIRAMPMMSQVVPQGPRDAHKARAHKGLDHKGPGRTTRARPIRVQGGPTRACPIRAQAGPSGPSPSGPSRKSQRERLGSPGT